MSIKWKEECTIRYISRCMHRYMTSVASVQREVERLKQKAFPKRKEDIWLVWGVEDDNPDETVTIFRGATRERPNPVELKCKCGDASKEIECMWYL